VNRRKAGVAPRARGRARVAGGSGARTVAGGSAAARTVRRGETAIAKAETLADSRFAAVVRAFLGDRGVTYGGKGFGATALKLDGRIFAMLSSNGDFVVKLPRERVDELVGSGQARYFEPGRGRRMKEWAAMTGDSARWLDLAREAYRFAKEGPV
jgi:hypothetical protein